MGQSNSQHHQAWIVLLVAIPFMVVFLARAGVFSSGATMVEESTQKDESSTQPLRLPDDLVAVADARYASLDGLAPGSRDAQDRQRLAVRQLGLPLEVKSAKTGIVFRLVPPGSFTMGSPRTEQDAMVLVGMPREWVHDEVAHEVTLSEAFYCGKFEVTQGQWEQVMGTTPSYFKNAGKNAPVEQVSWDDCQEFLNKLCQIEGAAEGTYRLLTEAEWEYACRAGTQTALYIGDLVIEGLHDAPVLDDISWYGGNSGVAYEGGFNSSDWREKQYGHTRAGTHAVGGKRANGFGLYDMIGNLWEWCQDWYTGYPDSPPLSSAVGCTRIARGGGWDADAWDCRSAERSMGALDDRVYDLGFRITRTIRMKPQHEPKNEFE